MARLLAPIDDPLIAEFVRHLDEVNALAEAAPGLVWWLKSDSGNAPDIPYSDESRLLVSMSV